MKQRTPTLDKCKRSTSDTTLSEGSSGEASPVNSEDSTPTSTLVCRTSLSPKNLLPRKAQQKLIEAKKWFIGKWEQAPKFIQDNEYIRSGYRINFNNIKCILRSLFMIHNETVNVWSHLIGVAVFFAMIFIVIYYIGPNLLFPTFQAIRSVFIDQVAIKLPDISLPEIKIPEFVELSQIYIMEIVKEFGSDIYEFMEKSSLKMKDNSFISLQEALDVLQSYTNGFGQNILDILNQNNKENNTPVITETGAVMNHIPKWPLYVQIGSAIFCLSCSAIFHLFSAHCKSSGFFARLDYGGIAILICGSPYPPFIYGFACTPFYIYLYLTLITIACLTAFIIMLIPATMEPRYRTLRAFLFIGIGIFDGLPVFHAIFSNDPDIQINPLFWILGGIAYIGGALLYAARIPERFMPGKFDIIGASHQIFHLFILVGAFLHFYGSINAYYLRNDNMCSAVLENFANIRVAP